MSYEIGTNARVIRRMAILTVVSILISVPLTLAGMALFFGFNLDAVTTVRSTFAFGLSAAIIVPAIICPITCYKIVMIIRERDRAHSELRRVSQTDPLTGLLNRRGFDTLARSAFASCKSEDESISILMIDIDYFKAVNDSLGHDFGDAAIVHVAAILSKDANAQGYCVARQGGEEFIAILPGTDIDQATAVAERLRIACAEAPVAFNHRSLSVFVSIGVSSRRHSIASLPRLISEADIALYEAKQQGRNRVVRHRTIVAISSAA